MASRSVLKAAEPFPESVRRAIAEVADDSFTNQGIREMMGRWTEFSSPHAALLAGIYMMPEARAEVDKAMDKAWASRSIRSLGSFDMGKTEVVIGAGLQAAIYCAVRVRNGNPPPLVLEASTRVGGIFAISENPSFFLNSRNRPGSLGLPGSKDALNVLPGALVQPSDLGGDEYQTNSALAWVIRTTLSAYATVIPATEVTRVGANGTLSLNGQAYEKPTKRTIVAAGVGPPKKLTSIASDRVMSFEQLMSRMDGVFPLRGMKRVAVIGDGDSGKTAIEALTGQGPTTAWSVASLDYPERITWYGPKLQTNKQDWDACNRSRYKAIGKLLPVKGDARASFRVQPILKKAQDVSPGYECVYVDGEPYDYVIVCIGHIRPAKLQIAYDRKLIGERTVAGAYQSGGRLYAIGPSVDFLYEPDSGGPKENAVSLFLTAGRTAAFAASLGD